MRHRALPLAAVLILSACISSPIQSTSPSPSPSPSPRETQPLVAVVRAAAAFKSEVELVALDGTVVARALADIGSAASAGGNHAAWVDPSGNLWDFTADGRTRQIARLTKPTFAGIDSTILSFEMSFDGSRWAWIAEADDWKHPWPANRYDPTVYSDVYVGGTGITPKLVYHDVSNGFLRLYRWTALGPIFYWHPYADLGTPFPATYGSLSLVDVESGRVSQIMEGLLDLGADGMIASSTYQAGSGPTVAFARIGLTTTIDLTGFYDCDVQFKPEAATTTAVIALAERDPQRGASWLYRTWVVDVGSGRMVGQPFMNARPVWRAWLPDGRLLLERTSPTDGLFIYSPDDGSTREIATGRVNVIGVLTRG